MPTDPLPTGLLGITQKIRQKIAAAALPPGGNAVLFWCTIANTDQNTVDAYINGSGNLSQGLRYSGTYTPIVGDVAWGICCNGDYFVCGDRA